MTFITKGKRCSLLYQNNNAPLHFFRKTFIFPAILQTAMILDSKKRSCLGLSACEDILKI